MAFNGSGVFNRLYNWVTDAASGIKILASRMDAEMDGMATGLSTCITKDGQTNPTANLPMATFKHTGVGNASARDQYPSAAQVQDSTITYAADSGAADAYSITPVPAITAYATGQKFSFKALNTNTGASTLNVNAAGTKAIKGPSGNALVAGAIVAGKIVEVRYDGTDFVLTNISGGTNYTNQGAVNYATASGTDTYTATLGLTAYVSGAEYRIKFTNANTSTAPTLNLDSLGAKTIKSLSGAALLAGDIAAGAQITLRYDGTDLLATSISSASATNVQEFTSSGTWTKPGYPATSRVFVQAWGGGGSGAHNTSSNGAGGGGGGSYKERWLTLSDMGATETITVAAGGASVPSGSTSGSAGGNTTVGSLLTAYGGGGGAAAGGVAAGGGGGGGEIAAGTSNTGTGTAAGGALGGGTGTDGSGSGNSTTIWGAGGGGGVSAVNSLSSGGNAIYGGGGGAAEDSNGVNGTAGTSQLGGAGGAPGVNGSAPAGGGGGSSNAGPASGAGGAGKVVIIVFK